VIAQTKPHLFLDYMPAELVYLPKAGTGKFIEVSMFWLKLFKDILAIFQEGQSPRQVAGGFMLGSFIGLSPATTLQGMVIWLIILVLNVNLGAVTLSFTLCSLAAFFLDPLFHWLGYQILVNWPAMQGFWAAFYNLPLAPLTRFNNTVVMGSFVAAIGLALPIYFGLKRLVIAYRRTLGSRVQKLKLYQLLKKSALARLYMQIKEIGGR
jgi:uncharacterized protein (TIGR03546 family)